MYRVGVVGINLYGKIYGRAFARRTDVKLVGFAHAAGDFEQDIPPETNAPIYENLEQMLDAQQLDVLCVCSATAQHAEHALMALSSSIHVLCERPIAMTIDEAQQMAEASHLNDATLMVGHVLRFWPEYVEARNLIHSGELGAVRSITTSRVSGTLNPDWSQRLLNPTLGLGSLEALVHDVDWLDWLLDGSLPSVLAHGCQSDAGSWGQVQCLFGYPGGKIAQLETSYLVPLSFPLAMYLRVETEKGTVTFDFRGALSSRGQSTRQLTITRVGKSPEVVTVEPVDAYEAEIDYFLECVASRTQPALGSAEQATRALQVILEVAERARDGAG